MPTFLALLGMFISVLLIGIILLQRGRGGGLVGALSGLGGQSAFGTKAGDTFTRITIALAAVWVLLAGVHGQVLRARTEKFKNDTATTEIGSSNKDLGSESTKTKTDDKKSDPSLDTTTDASNDENMKAEGSNKKREEQTKEIAPDDENKPDSVPKSKDSPKKELDDSAEAKPDEKSGESK